MKQYSPFVIITHVINNAVVDGFIPAIQSLGHHVLLLTDHAKAYSTVLDSSIRIVETDVFNPLAILDTLTNIGCHPIAVFSNSDHLQTSTSIVATTMALPAKDWKICYCAKEKLRMRERLNQLQLPNIWTKQWFSNIEVDAGWPFPIVVKPSQGVSSLNVRQVDDVNSLKHILKYFEPQESVLLESYIEGELFTLETLGDGTNIIAIGGFDVELSEPPFFIEKQARWNGVNAKKWQEEALRQISEFGINFGACHSEFIATDTGPVLVEINYRSIGDGREFLLDRILPSGWFKPIIALYLNQGLPATSSYSQHALIHYLVANDEGVLKTSPNVPNINGVTYLPIKKQGDAIQMTNSNKDYIGVLYIEESDSDTLDELACDVLTKIQWKIG